MQIKCPDLVLGLLFFNAKSCACYRMLLTQKSASIGLPHIQACLDLSPLIGIFPQAEITKMNLILKFVGKIPINGLKSKHA